MKERSRILVVDDHVTNLAIVEETLGDDCEVRCVWSGAEALEVAPTFRPDLVLLDIMMPGIDGYETCRRFRAHPQLRHVKIVLVSAKSQTIDRLRGYEAGADDYLTKPFLPEELTAKVRVFLRLKSVEELDQMKTEILTLLAHETRTPLTCLIGGIEILRAPEELPEEKRREILEIAWQGCARLQSLMEKSDLLWRLRARQIAANLGPVDARAIVTGSVERLEALASERRVRVVVDAPPGVMVQGDEKLLSLVVQALVENAIRFSPAAGEVRVEVVQGKRDVTLAVIDKGPGVDPAQAPYLFDAFVTHDLAHHTQGQGLSLALSREIIESHGGTIELAPRKRDETKFIVRIPTANVMEKAPVAT